LEISGFGNEDGVIENTTNVIDGFRWKKKLQQFWGATDLVREETVPELRSSRWA